MSTHLNVMASRFTLVFTRFFFIATTTIEMMISVIKISRIRPPIIPPIKIPAENNDKAESVKIIIHACNSIMNLYPYSYIITHRQKYFSMPLMFIPKLGPLPPRSSDLHSLVVLSSVKPSLHTELENIYTS